MDLTEYFKLLLLKILKFEFDDTGGKRKVVHVNR